MREWIKTFTEHEFKQGTTVVYNMDEPTVALKTFYGREVSLSGDRARNLLLEMEGRAVASRLPVKTLLLFELLLGDNTHAR